MVIKTDPSPLDKNKSLSLSWDLKKEGIVG